MTAKDSPASGFDFLLQRHMQASGRGEAFPRIRTQNRYALSPELL